MYNKSISQILDRLRRRIDRYIFYYFRKWTKNFGLFAAWGPDQTTAFTSAFVVLSGKMAAADGIAVSSEAEAFERFLEVPDSEKAHIRRLFNQAKKDVRGYEIYADKVGEILQKDPETKRRVFECLMYIACADGVLHSAEDHFLKVVASRFSYSDVEYRNIRSLFVQDPESPFNIMDLSSDASLQEIRSRYRKLVRQCHPDRLISEGAPPAVIKAATAKLAHINEAYKKILQERGLGG